MSRTNGVNGMEIGWWSKGRLVNIKCQYYGGQMIIGTVASENDLISHTCSNFVDSSQFTCIHQLTI